MDNQDRKLLEFGEQLLEGNEKGHRILFLSVIGEIEGHEILNERMKTTKYEHLLPLLARAQDTAELDGILLLINTVGGDCSCGLAAAEMIASIDKPVVSLIIGDSHSIGVPLSVASDYTIIAPTATMLIHPVRLSGTVIGAPQTFEYFKLIQDRILNFTAGHSRAGKKELEKMMEENDLTQEEKDKIRLGIAMVRSALERRESRGAHQRLDAPETCREFCKTTVAAFDGRQVTVRFRDIPADREAKRE